MKLTGAVIANNYENSIQKREVKNNAQQRKETPTSEVLSNIPVSSVSKLESMGIANLEKSKYFQTQVSLAQKSEGNLNRLYEKLYDLEEASNNSSISEIQKNIKIQEIIKGIEAILGDEEFQKSEILSTLDIQSLGLDGYISSTEKEKVLNEAFLKVRIKNNELTIIKEKNENELTKLKLANENLKAANSVVVDRDNLMSRMNNVKNSIENNPMDIRNLSQARVMNILND